MKQCDGAKPTPERSVDVITNLIEQITSSVQKANSVADSVHGDLLGETCKVNESDESESESGLFGCWIRNLTVIDREMDCLVRTLASLRKEVEQTGPTKEPSGGTAPGAD